MPPLKNVQHEAFLQHLANQVKNPPDNGQPIRACNSYKAVYGVNGETSINNSSRILSREDAKARFIELLEKDPRTSDEGLKNKLGELVNARSEGVQLGALNTAFKIKGHLSDGQSTQNVSVANVMFNKVLSPNIPHDVDTQVSPEGHTTNTNDDES